MNRIGRLMLFVTALTALAAGGGTRAQQTPAATAGAPLLELFYQGSRISRLESCGCHSRQQGGVQYEAVLYDRFAATPAIKVDLGQWVAPDVNMRPEELMLTRYLMRAFTMLKMDAINLGLYDLELTTDFFKEFNEKHPGQMPPLVSANIYIKDQPNRRAYEPYRIVEKKLGDGSTIKVGITGVCWLIDEEHSLARGVKDPPPRETISFVAKRPKECLLPVVAELRTKVDLLIVLSSGDVASGVELAKAFPEVDVVIARNASGAPQVDGTQTGNVRVLLGRNIMGKEVGHTTLERGKDAKWQLKNRPEYLAVNKDVDPKPEYVTLIEEFKRDTKTLKPKLPPEGVKEAYAGALRCSMCHKKEYESWQKTRHKKAIETLINKGQQFNPTCVKCHVTGYQQDNGFYTIGHAESEKMMNVQCEECHGPGMIHSDAQQLKASGGQNFLPAEDFKKRMEEEKLTRPHKAVPEATCLKCHTPENDDNFDYKIKLPKVKH